MINIDVLQELHKYNLLYEQRWGQEIDYVGIPNVISEERLLLIFRYIVNTGESVLVGLQKVRDIIHEYHNYIDENISLNDSKIKNGYIFEKPCPLCGNKVIYLETGKSYSFTCNTEHCLNIISRGI